MGVRVVTGALRMAGRVLQAQRAILWLRHGRVAERHDGAEATRLVVAVDPPQLERFVVKFGGAVEILRPRQDLIHSSTKR